MLARIRSAGIHGIQARSVSVEVDVATGLPSFSTVGCVLPYPQKRESNKNLTSEYIR